MKALRDRAALILAVISLAVSGFLFSSRPDPAMSPSLLSSKNSEIPPEADESRRAMAELAENLQLLSADLDDLRRTLGNVAPPSETIDDDNGESGDEGVPRFASVDERLRALEGSLARLQSNYEGISMEASSAERAEIFASEEGAIRADEYFEAGKYSIAAEGYLTYYRNHPEDPDARGVLNRARSAYQRAGYPDMAIWVQEEMMRIFPESRATDLRQLAAMQKSTGNLDGAIASAAESAELQTNAQERLWTRLYWAWYNQLRDGASAGLDAYREVQQEIEAAGYADHKLNNRAQQKIEEIQREIAAGNR